MTSVLTLRSTWYSIEGSFNEFLQIAQVSAQISHDHIVTAFHFLISNRGATLDEELLSSLTPELSSIMATSTSLFSSAIVQKSLRLKARSHEILHFLTTMSDLITDDFVEVRLWLLSDNLC